MTLAPHVVGAPHDQGAADVLVTVGGTIPADDTVALKQWASPKSSRRAHQRARPSSSSGARSLVEKAGSEDLRLVAARHSGSNSMPIDR